MRSKLLLGILLFSVIVAALPIQIEAERFVIPPKKIADGIDRGEMDWSLFWQLFRSYAYWDLEWFDGAGWQSKRDSLTIEREYPEPNDCKITLIFDAPEQGDYRLTFAVDRMVKNYVQRESRYQWRLEYDEFNLIFDWTDIMEIPGIQATKGVKNGYFWFRINRDNVPQGYHVEIDPHLIVEDQKWTSNTVRISNSTYFCLVEMKSPVNGQHDLWRSTDSGQTWEDMGCITEAYGSNVSLSQAMLCADTVDSSVIHLTWGGYGATEELRYTRFDNDTEAFSQNVQIINQRGYLHWMEIDSNNVLHLIWEDMTTSEGSTVYLRYISSSNGGLTWGFSLYDEQTAHETTPMITNVWWCGQCLKTTWNGNVEYFSAYVDGSTPAVTVRCDVYATTGTYGVDAKPTGEILASSDNLDFDAVPGNSWFNFTFSTPWEPTYGVVYAYIVKNIVGSTGWKIGTTQPSKHDGNIAYTPNGGETWYAQSSQDLAFKIYGEWSDLLDTNSWNDWYVNHQLLVTRNDVVNVKWRENDPGAKNHRYMYMRRFTNGTWTTPEDVAGSWDSTYPAGGSDWSSDPQDRLIYTLHNGSSAFSPIKGADIYLTYTAQPTNYSGSLGWIEPICINSGKVWIQDPSVQIDDTGAAHLIAQEWVEGWNAGEFPNPTVGNVSLHYINEPGYPWNSWSSPVKLNTWHSQCGFGFTRGSAYPIHNRVAGAETFDFVFMVWQGVTGEYDIYYQLLSLIVSMDATVTNMEGCGNWLFAEERYYNFIGNVTIVNTYLHTMEMKFTDKASNLVQWYYINSTTDSTGYHQNSSEFMRMRDFRTSDVTISGSTVSVSFDIYLTKNLVDSPFVDLWMHCNTTEGMDSGWLGVATDLFHLYSVGGLTLSTNTTGNAGRISGGDVFDFYCENGSSVESEMIWRDLQHIKIVPSIFYYPIESTIATFYMEYRFDYCTQEDDGWIKGFGLKMKNVEGQVSGTKRYQKWEIKLMNRGNEIQTENVYSFTRYNSSDYGGVSETQFFLDFWFNKLNASSSCGTRINAYEYAMRDTTSPWISWLVGANWNPWEGKPKDMMLFTPLLDADNNILFTSEIKLVRLYFKLWMIQYGDETFTAEVRNYKIWDLTFDNQPPFDGCQTPPMDDTKIPYIYGGGLLGSLWSAITGLWTDIFAPTLLTWADILIGWLDTVAGMMGYPKFFTHLFNYLGTLWNGFVTGVLSFASILGTGLSFLTLWLSGFLSILNDALTRFIEMWQIGVDMIGGAYGTGVDIWEAFNVPMWITLALIFYPLYLVIMWDEHGTDRVISHLKAMAWIPTLVFKILSWMIMGFISILSAIIEAIPLAE